MKDKIVSITWNPRVVAVKDTKTCGRTSTDKYIESEAFIGYDVEDIKEITPLVYDIYYKDGGRVRITNPIAVTYEK